MLVDVKTKRNEIGDFIAKVSGHKESGKKHKTGIYEIGHFNFEHSIDDSYEIEKYPELPNDFPEEGVCDDVDQLLRLCPEIAESDGRKFVISITMIDPDDQPPEDGWRWSKWGEYIGEKEVKTQYIYDQKDEIDEVWVYHIFEIL